MRRGIGSEILRSSSADLFQSDGLLLRMTNVFDNSNKSRYPEQSEGSLTERIGEESSGCSVKHKGYLKKSAFTLAEVLITLGIVGVIAAITIPNLIDTNKVHVARTKFKKTVSVLNQAVKLSQQRYDLDFSTVTNSCGNCLLGNDSPENSTSLVALFNGSLNNITFKHELWMGGWKFKTHSEGFSDSVYFGYQMQDGTIFAFIGGSGHFKYCHLEVGEVINNEWIKNNPKCFGYIDINGMDGPNEEVSCTSGTTALAPDEPCFVKKDIKYLTDIFPVVYHDSIVEPASNAAAYVLKN